MNCKKTEEAKFDFIIADDNEKIEDLYYFLKEFLGANISEFDVGKFNYQIGISIKTDVPEGVTFLNVKLKSVEADVSDVNQLSLFNQNSDEDDFMIIKDRKQKNNFVIGSNEDNPIIDIEKVIKKNRSLSKSNV